MAEISNIIGIELPKYITSQLQTRSVKNSVKENRTNDDLIYMANKTAWIRVVSSIDISNEDIAYFKNYVEQQDQYNSLLGYDIDYDIGYGISYTDPSFLAKKFVLFGGVSKYDNTNKKYNLRSGLNGAYSPLGENEVNAYGYRPMPGITSAVIDTAGRMGSIRYATISFKVWDKMQLDIIDALYFKLGYSMFIEWGQTYFYSNEDTILEREDYKLYASEDYSVNPFSTNWSKESLNIAIARASEKSHGNYDAMLGTCTNFNFSMNQEGGYDCTLKVIGLGFLADSIKINQPSALVDVLNLEIKRAVDYKNKVEEEKAKIEKAKNDQAEKEREFDENNLLALLLNDYRVKISQKYDEPAKIRYKYYSDSNGDYLIQNKISFENNSLTSQPVLDLNAELFLNPNFINYPSKYVENNSLTDYYRRNYILPYTNELIIASLGVKLNNDIKYTATLDVPYIKTKIPINKEFSLLPNKTNPPDFTKSPLQKTLESKAGLKIISGVGANAGDVYLILDYYSDLNIGGKKLTKPYYVKFEISGKSSNYISGIDKEISKIPLSIEEVETPIFSSIIQKIVNETFNGSSFELGRTESNFKSGEVILKAFSTDSYAFENTVFDKKIESSRTQFGNEIVTESFVKTNYEINYTITVTTNDSSIFYDISPDDSEKEFENLEDVQNRLKSQDSTTDQVEDLSPDLNVKDVQKEELSKYRSGLELALRAIQLHCLNNVYDQHVDGILDDVLKVDLLNSKSKNIKDSLAGTIFSSNGVFKNIFEQIVDESLESKYSIKDRISDYINPNLDRKERLIINAKYGFSNSLMSVTDSKEIPDNLSSVDYKKLLNAFVVPYIIDNSYIGGGENSVQINHPVYINIGTLIAIVNNMCTLYETETEKISSGDTITPLVYIDFNPETNLCLSNPQHISVNPLQFIIPCYSSQIQFEQLFDSKIAELIKNDKDQSIKLFDPPNDDRLSGDIYETSPFKFFGTDAKDTYKGKIMNVLVNIDYLLQTIRTFSTNDGNGSVYLRSFIERIVFDLNKSLGSFNILRLAYNDKSNVMYIIDDQLVPSSKDKQPSQTSEFVMPLYGRNSIARNLEMRTEISSKLGSMIAIASNPTSELQNAISQDVTSFGFINQNYKDRYIKYKQDATIDKRTEEQIKEDKEREAKIATVVLEQDKTSAIRFNAAVKGFFGAGDSRKISVDDINSAINYYTNRMSVLKTKSKATRASVLIPVSLNFTTDGIGGINMYNSFSVPEDLLPYTYSARSAVNFGYEKDYIKKVGFCVVGLTHKFDSNTWTTDVRSNMVYVKNNIDYAEFITQSINNKPWDGTTGTQSPLIESVDISNINLNQSWERIAFDFIAKRESFSSAAYFDQNRYRAGYGTDYILYSDGIKKPVDKSTKVTQQDGDRTLIYRIKNDFARTVIRQIGQNNWDKLKDNQKAALVSFAYNVGSLRQVIIKEIVNGSSPQAVSKAIASGPYTGQKSGYLRDLFDRRQKEAALYLG